MSLYFLLNSWAKWFTIQFSKSSPPRCVSPAVALTLKMPSSMVLKQGDTKCSTTEVKYQDIFLPHTSCFLVKTVSYSSLMIRITFKPAMTPAYFVACLWESLKYVGTSDDRIFDSGAKVNFCNLLHLDKNHCWDFFCSKSPLLFCAGHKSLVYHLVLL